MCKLSCVSEQTKDIMVSEHNVVDGTFCSYDRPHDICIKGRCQVSQSIPDTLACVYSEILVMVIYSKWYSCILRGITYHCRQWDVIVYWTLGEVKISVECVEEMVPRAKPSEEQSLILLQEWVSEQHSFEAALVILRETGSSFSLQSITVWSYYLKMLVASAFVRGIPHLIWFISWVPSSSKTCVDPWQPMGK